jgi:hypothetical protein
MTHHPFNRDRRTWAAYLLLGLFAYLETSIGPVMPFLRAELGLGYAVASLHFSAFAAGGVAAGLTASAGCACWGESAPCGAGWLG